MRHSSKTTAHKYRFLRLRVRLHRPLFVFGHLLQKNLWIARSLAVLPVCPFLRQIGSFFNGLEDGLEDLPELLRPEMKEVREEWGNQTNFFLYWPHLPFSSLTFSPLNSTPERVVSALKVSVVKKPVLKSFLVEPNTRMQPIPGLRFNTPWTRPVSKSYKLSLPKRVEV